MQKDNDIFSIFEGEILDRAKFDAIMDKMVSKVKAEETGTIAYEWTVSQDGQSCLVYERYRDNEAYLTHLQGFGAGAEEFLAAVKPTRLALFGEANAAVKEAIAGFAPGYFAKVGGFVR